MREVTEVRFAKVHPNATIPSKRDEDMGFDIYACFDEDYIVINPHETKLIPTGIASACNPKYGFIVFERGSTGSKGIARRCGVIDSGYRNEWFIGLTNTTNKVMFISKLSEKETYNNYYGDVIRNIRNLASSVDLNDDINISNEISIVADPFANQNFHSMRYVEFMGTKWKVSKVDASLYPRLTLSVGGVYNGQQTKST